MKIVFKKIFIFIVSFGLIFTGFVYLNSNNKNEVTNETNPVVETIEEENIEEVVEAIDEEEQKIERYIEKYNEYSYGNPDYKGVIEFESGLLKHGFVQASDNNYYLRRNYKDLTYSELGSIFVDYECDLDSRNLILYGHYVYAIWDSGYDWQ